MPTPTQAELYTAIRNTSGAEHTFSFLGPRGMRMAADEVVLIPGDFVATLGAETQEGRRRKFNSLERSLAEGRLSIDSRPAPVLYDETLERAVSLSVVNGVLGTVVPTYDAGQSESFSAV